MKYARDRKITSTHTAEVLIEAFPWIKNATGKTILIKYGGAAMVDPELRNAVMSDIVMLKIMGVNPVIVHGGGAAINKNMEKFGIDVEFKDGQRVTSEEAMDVVKMTLVGKVNEELVLAMNEHGNLAVGVNGTDAGTIIAEQRSPELGRVGRVSSGMIPKLQSCVEAIEGGVPRAHIVNGTKPHSILVELLTSSGSGTLIYDDTVEFSKEEMRPLGILASRLSENL